jgi:hypothetical protein
MTASLEKIVRPFQTEDIGPPKHVPAAAPADGTVRNMILNPGKNGQVKTFSGSYSITITLLR